MKKAFLLALAALCVSAVQAVTTTWTGKGGTTLNQPFSFENADYFNVSIVLSGNSTAWSGSSGDTIFQIKDSKGNNVVHFTVYKDGGWHFKVNGVGGKNINKNGDNTEDITITLSATKENGVWSDLTWTWYSVFNKSHETYEQNKDQTFEAEGTITNANISDIASIIVTNKLAGDATLKISNVPEPTALALLALGVAGLALKRKVA
jgi:hypothetical protein